MYAEGLEVTSATLGVFIGTSREDTFDRVVFNTSLVQIKNISAAVNDCKLGKTSTYTYEFSRFVSTALDDHFIYKYTYDEYPHVLCPMSVYNTTAIVFIDATKHDLPVLNQFTTRKYF